MATIAGIEVQIVNDSIRPELRMSLGEPVELEARNVERTDRGAAQDVYEGTFSVRGVRSVLDQFIFTLGLPANKGAISAVFNGGEMIFGPEITETDITIIRYPKHVRGSFGRFFADDIRIRALSPISTGTADFTQLKLAAHRYTADVDWNIRKHFAYIPSVMTVADRQADGGFFQAIFRQTTAEMIGIRRYITTVARGNSIPFPDIQGLTYPWGPRGSSVGGNCRIEFFGNERRVGQRWEFEMHFRRDG